MKKLAAFALILVLAASAFAACAAPDPTGRYTLQSINGQTPAEYFKAEADEEGLSLADLLSFLGLPEDKLNEFMTLTLEKEGKATIQIFGEDAAECTWELKGGTLYLTDDDGTQELAYKNGAVTVVDKDVTYVLGK